MSLFDMRVRDEREPELQISLLRTGGIVAIASAVLGLLLSASWGGGATLAAISVRGAQHLSPEEVARASGVQPGASLAEVDADAAAARLAEHAWIREARALVLPTGRLVLDVTEYLPVAILDGHAVNAEGVAFAPVPEGELSGLPRLSAPPGVDLSGAVALARRLPELGLPAPEEVGVSAEHDPAGYSLRLPGLAPLVLLGRDDLEAKLANLAELLEADRAELATASRIDLRFRDQAVLDQAAAAPDGAVPSNARPTG